MRTPTELTQLLQRWHEGDQAALEELTPLVYGELHRLASGYLRRERANHTLQATEVVHEAFVRLLGVDVAWQDRVHFCALAARIMRRLLVDHARGRAREKRGGGLDRFSLHTADAVVPGPSENILALEDAMSRLARRDERAASAVELHHFGGLTHEEVAHVLGVSAATVKRDLRVARAWLRRELESVENAH